MLCRILLSLSIATATVSAAPAIAAACGNAMFVQDDDAVKQVAEAERLLVLGKLTRAEDKVDPHRYRFDAPGVQRRADIVWATVAFRQASSGNDWREKRAIAILERELKSDEESPVLLARLAEGYSLNADSQERARAMLEDLATRDLMPDAFGYRTLAKLRAAAGDKEAATAALEQCSTMTTRKDVCTLAARKSESKRLKSRPAPRKRAARN